MVEGSWRAWAGQLTYRRPYEDAWGMLHDPTTEWDELFKYCQPWVRLLVSQGTRRMARPAEAAAHELIRGKQKEKRGTMARAAKLEADYLKWNNCRKQWKRRQEKKVKAKPAPSGA